MNQLCNYPIFRICNLSELGLADERLGEAEFCGRRPGRPGTWLRRHRRQRGTSRWSHQFHDLTAYIRRERGGINGAFSDPFKDLLDVAATDEGRQRRRGLGDGPLSTSDRWLTAADSGCWR